MSEWPTIEGFGEPTERCDELFSVRSRDGGGHWFGGSFESCVDWAQRLRESPGGDFEVVVCVRSALVYQTYSDWRPVTADA